MTSPGQCFHNKMYFRNVNDSTVYIVLYDKFNYEQMLDTAVGGGKKRLLIQTFFTEFLPAVVTVN